MEKKICSEVIMNNNNSFNNLVNKIREIKKLDWIKCENRNNNIAGIKLEKLIGKEIENFEIPDFEGIEIKTKCSKYEEYLSLFNATPDSYLFEIKRLHEKYGYPDKDLPEFNVLNFSVTSINWCHINELYNAILRVDKKNRIVILEIYNNKYELIDNFSKWSFDILEEKLYRKLKYLCFVEAKKKYINKDLYIKYENDSYFKLKGFEEFIKLINNGYIRICFCIGIYKSGKKLGQIHDHGTSFEIKVKNLNKLFIEL